MDETLIISGYTNASDQKCVQRLLKKSTHLCVEKTETNSVCVTVEMCVCTSVKCIVAYADTPSKVFAPPFRPEKHILTFLTSLHRGQDSDCAETRLHYPFTFSPPDLWHKDMVQVHLLSYAYCKNYIRARSKIAYYAPGM